MMDSPRILNVAMHIDERYGGIASSMPLLCDALASVGERVDLVTFCDGEERQSATVPERRGYGLEMLPAGWPQWIASRKLRSRLGGLIAESSIVHIHGIWQEHCFLAANLARRASVPYMISAHGMLEPWALRNKGWKKKLYGAAFERPNLRRAACLRALTEAEAEDYRRYGYRGTIAVIPNGVRPPLSVSKREFLSAFPELEGKRVVLFLGRIHYKKGVYLLVDAFERIAKKHPAAQLIMAGPDSENTLAAVRRKVTEASAGARVTFTGMLNPTMKWSALAAASVFVLPSFSEGFSVATLEALAAGVPPLISRQCYFPSVEHARAGVVVEPEVEAVAEALDRLLSASPDDLASMGRNGAMLARSRYSWEAVAADFKALHRWILHGGSAPRCVQAS